MARCVTMCGLSKEDRLAHVAFLRNVNAYLKLTLGCSRSSRSRRRAWLGLGLGLGTDVTVRDKNEMDGVVGARE